MRGIIFYSVLILTVVFTNISCDKVLNVKPPNIISGSQIFKNTESVKAEIATLYSGLPLNGYTYVPAGDLSLSDMTGMTMPNGAQDFNERGGDGTYLEWWDGAYSTIRNINKFLKNLKDAKGFTQSQLKEWKGEALFLRAFDYFSLVKRYGGVPLITKAQNYTGDNLSELQVPREKEKKIYDFIASQLDKAASLLGPTSEEPGRVNKYVALTLKSRAMLFAASEAENAAVQLNGVIGIPTKDAKHYWEEAYNAAKKVIKTGGYSLYKKYPNNSAKNFQLQFLDAKTNPGVIWAKYYHYPQVTHTYDLQRVPREYESPEGYSSNQTPGVQLVEAFNYKDGSSGKLKIKNNQGKSIEYKNPLDLFKNRDPRLSATVILPFSKWRGNVVHVRAGIITAPGDTMTGGTYKGMPAVIGIGSREESLTGFYIRKHLNTNASPENIFNGTDQPWIIFRFGGVLLNYAEAAIELGKKYGETGKIQDAVDAINSLHARAGISPVKQSQITIETVRHERLVEMIGSRRYFWDARRWRILDNYLVNYRLKALVPYYVAQDKAYIFKIKKVGYPMTFQPKQYYLKIPTDEINKDKKLKQNPGY